ncbi:MAG: hypothetical protein BMS9Abin36_1191 [Gammaproteobacteria bacterium]|nr:MAG: hypothetical protein BMS9Abin36_1191 [Gammaproteobacteria bacterium]
MEFLMIASSKYLIDTMLVILIIALGLRFLSHRASKDDQLYYSTFTREIEKRVERDDIGKIGIDDIEEYVEDLLDEVATNLPSRSVRVMKSDKDKSSRKIRSVRDYAGGSQSLIHSLKSETNAFKAKQKPSFEQLADRVMGKDDHWVNLHGLFPIDSVIRMIDVLPGIFIVIGIFGTFVGITNALPQIAEIDFNNISNSSSVLSLFVKDVSFAMRTSIAGIVFSLIISLLNTLFPISTIRNSIARGLEDSLEYLWYFVHGGRGDNKQSEAFSQMVVLLENIDEKIDDPSSDIVSSGKGGKQKTKVYTKMIDLLENINKNFSKPASNKSQIQSKTATKTRTKATKTTKTRAKATKARPKTTKARTKTRKAA